MMLARCCLGAFTLLSWSSASLAQGPCQQWDDVAGDPAFEVWCLEQFETSGTEYLYAAGVNGIARTQGTNWQNLVGGGPLGGVYDMQVFDDGGGPDLYVGGGFFAPSVGIARWNNGWSNLGSGVNGSVYGLCVFDDGSGDALFVGGEFTTAGGQPANNIAKWDGLSWSALGAGTNFEVQKMVVFDDGSGAGLYVCGWFTMAGGATANRVARWNGSSWSSLEPGINGTVYDLEVFDDGNGPDLYAGGEFSVAGGFLCDNIARWDGSAWNPVGSGVNGRIEGLAVSDYGFGSDVLFAGGAFTVAGGTAAMHVATWNGSSWEQYQGGTNNRVRDFRIYSDASGTGPALHIGGAFTTVGVGLPSPTHAAYVARSGPFNGTSAFCNASDGSLAACPCGNMGTPESGCDNPQGTGGVRLSVCQQSSNAATMYGTGFPAMGANTALLIRSHLLTVGPLAFGDGIICLPSPVVRLSATFSQAGTTTHQLGHGAGPGRFYYQVWYRSLPSTYCVANAGWNLSNGQSLDW